MKTDTFFMGSAFIALLLFVAWEFKRSRLVSVEVASDETTIQVRGVAAADLGVRYSVDLGLTPKPAPDASECEGNGNG